jgi:hypothetical protein
MLLAVERKIDWCRIDAVDDLTILDVRCHPEPEIGHVDPMALRLRRIGFPGEPEAIRSFYSPLLG